MRQRQRFALTLVASFFTSCALSATPAGAGSPEGSGISWPEEQALPTFAEAQHLDVADIETLPGDEQLALVSLQGLVNREQPRLYLLQSNDDEGKYTWLKKGLNLPYREVEDLWQLLDKYRKYVQGMIVYDPEMPDSINVATTLAGLRDGLVVSPALAARLGNRYDLKVSEDLRGRFTDRLDAYTWQTENLWDETTRRMLIGLAPTRNIEVPPGRPDTFEVLLREEKQLRDASNREIYTLELTPFLKDGAVYVRFEDSFPDDGWGAAVHDVTLRADGEVLAQFVPGSDEEAAYLYDPNGSQLNEGDDAHRFADNGRFFVYRFDTPEDAKALTLEVEMWNQVSVWASSTEPPNSSLQEPYGMLRDYAVANRAMVFWLDPNIPEERALLARIMDDVPPYTPYLGWFAQDVAGEFSGTELTSEHSVYVLAADWFANMTVFSGTRLQEGGSETQPSDDTPDDRAGLEDKLYLTLTVSEGDNLQYNEHRLRLLWDDPKRGSVPLNWTTNPLLLDAAPAILDYYQATATDNDLLIAGPSGAGYIYPTPWPDATLDSFSAQTRDYMARSGLNLIYVLNRVDGVSVPLEPSKVNAYEGLDLEGLLLGWETEAGLRYLPGGTPQATVRGVGSLSEADEVVSQAIADWDGTSPQFVALGILAWTLTPTDLEAFVAGLPDNVEVVRGDTFFQLAREARER